MFNFFKKKSTINKVEKRVEKVLSSKLILDLDDKDKEYSINSILYESTNFLNRSKKHISYYPAFDYRDASKSVVATWLQHLNFAPHHKYEISFNKIYSESIKNDLISVRSVANTLKKHELIKNYFWANSAEEIWKYVVSRGTVIFASKWFKGMTNLDQYNYGNISGKYVEDRAFLIYGVDANKKSFICRNCFGEEWGKNGDFYIYFDNIDKLFNLGAQACAAI